MGSRTRDQFKVSAPSRPCFVIQNFWGSVAISINLGQMYSKGCQGWRGKKTSFQMWTIRHISLQKENQAEDGRVLTDCTLFLLNLPHQHAQEDSLQLAPHSCRRQRMPLWHVLSQTPWIQAEIYENEVTVRWYDISDINAVSRELTVLYVPVQWPPAPLV